MQNILENIFWLTLVFGIPGVIAFVLTAFPRSVVRLQGKFYRYFYGNSPRIPSEGASELNDSPRNLFFISDYQEFAKNAVDSPEKFGRLIFIYRVLGMVIFVVLGLGIALLFLFFVS